jgi:hypothetical protein
MARREQDLNPGEPGAVTPTGGSGRAGQGSTGARRAATGTGTGRTTSDPWGPDPRVPTRGGVGATPPDVGDRPEEQGGGVVDQTKQKAGRVADQVQEKAAPVVEKAQEKAGQVADAAKQQATSRLEGQKERAVGGLGTAAHAIRQVGQQLREQEQPAVAQYADKAAEQVERFSGYLRQKDVDQLIREAEGFARRQPTVFLGGAFALGLLAARFLKSSGRRAAGASDARMPRTYAPGTYTAGAYTPTAESPVAGTRAHTPGYDADLPGRPPSPSPTPPSGSPPRATGI